MKITAIQSALRILYPARCLICGDIVESDFGLCAPCWGDMPFLDGLACDCCGAPLIGVSFDWAETCDDCLAQPRPWAKGRAALLYQGSARKLVLGLKHGDRTDVVRPAAQWLLSSCEDILTEDSLFVAVPLHWRRQLKRRYNQSSLLAYEMAKLGHYGFLDGALKRAISTKPLEKVTTEERTIILSGAIEVHRRMQDQLSGRSVVIVDDVMTSGATLCACTDVLLGAGCARVDVAVLARAVRNM
ncbi:MAG: ComF family protein [Rhodobacteraceae bacterium]|jgi:ComF family protein|nr:ComF family protein [Paracoccaceae bacterium]